MQAALRDAVAHLVDHVVAQVVEAEFVVRAVGDVGAERGLLLLALQARHVDTDAQPEEAIDPAHPLGVAAGEVVVDGDHMHALAEQRVEVDRQRRGQRLALAGAHLGDLALVQHDAADELDVEVAHLQHALAGLAHQREGLGQQRVERLAGSDAGAELVGLGAQGVVGQCFVLRLQRVDALDRTAVLLEQAVVARAEE